MQGQGGRNDSQQERRGGRFQRVEGVDVGTQSGRDTERRVKVGSPRRGTDGVPSSVNVGGLSSRIDGWSSGERRTVDGPIVRSGESGTGRDGVAWTSPAVEKGKEGVTPSRDGADPPETTHGSYPRSEGEK